MKTTTQIEKFTPISEIVWCLLTTIVFLGFPQVFSIQREDIGLVPFFDPPVIRSLWFFIVLWTTAGIVRESAKLILKQYVKRLLIITLICNTLAAICAGIVFLNTSLINPEFINSVVNWFAEAGRPGIIPTDVFINFNYIILAVFLFALILDTGITVTKTLKGGVAKTAEQ